MKLSEMIKELSAEFTEHGDVEVWFADDQYIHSTHTVEYPPDGLVIIRTAGA